MCRTHLKFGPFNDIAIAGLQKVDNGKQTEYSSLDIVSRHAVMWWKMGNQTGLTIRSSVGALKPSQPQQSEIMIPSKDGTYMDDINTINNHDQSI